jgi:hypothetical protein
MTEEEAAQLRKENQELREALKQTQELLRVALARIEELEKQKTPPPTFVKANVKKPKTEAKKPRKKREAQPCITSPKSCPAILAKAVVILPTHFLHLQEIPR